VTKLILFVVGTLLLAGASSTSLRRPHSHGFYRFFAWESILALVLLNFRGMRYWFSDPFCARQLASWLLLSGSLVPVTWGVYLLRTRGRAGATPDGRQLFEFEKTTQLVTTGLFRYVRHPLYCSLILLTWGVFLKTPSWVAVTLALAATGSLFATAKAEEAENRLYFGAAYEAYVRQSKMFVPFVL
jgi:protein-S-isoprenylcysteine O-methyltransferase Ste14